MQQVEQATRLAQGLHYHHQQPLLKPVDVPFHFNPHIATACEYKNHYSPSTGVQIGCFQELVQTIPKPFQNHRIRYRSRPVVATETIKTPDKAGLQPRTPRTLKSPRDPKHPQTQALPSPNHKLYGHENLKTHTHTNKQTNKQYPAGRQLKESGCRCVRGTIDRGSFCRHGGCQGLAW